MAFANGAHNCGAEKSVFQRGPVPKKTFLTTFIDEIAKYTVATLASRDEKKEADNFFSAHFSAPSLFPSVAENI